MSSPEKLSVIASLLHPPCSRWLLALLVLFAAGVLLPFTTSLHNICLPQTAAAENIFTTKAPRHQEDKAEG